MKNSSAICALQMCLAILACSCAEPRKPEPLAPPIDTLPLKSRPYKIDRFLPLKNGEAEIWYLAHAGYAVRTATKLLIFDYWQTQPARNDTTGLTGGVINLEELQGLTPVFFVTHDHPDHFNPLVFVSFQRQNPSLRWIVSNDVYDAISSLDTVMSNVFVPRLYRGTRIDNMIVRVIHSNDGGVAFVVSVDGIQLYFGGGHAWWAWDGYNPRAERAYKAELDRLSGLRFDLAFLPIEPRLREYDFAGALYFVKRFRPSLVLPMHKLGEAGSESIAFSNAVRATQHSDAASIVRRGDYVRFTKPSKRLR